MTSQAETLATSAALSAVLAIFQQLVLATLGVSLLVPVAAFAGVMYGITYRDAMTVKVLWGNIIGATIFVSVIAPAIGHWLKVPEVLTAGVAGMLGFLSQYTHAYIKQRQRNILNRALTRVLGPDEGDDK
jgi:hypothetical protein